jgi:hypothetical protein
MRINQRRDKMRNSVFQMIDKKLVVFFFYFSDIV